MSEKRPWYARLWPRRLMGQTVLLVLLALLAAQIVSALVFRSEARSFYRGAEIRFLAERIAPYAELMRATPPERRTQLAEALSNRRLSIWVSPEPAASKIEGKGHDDDDDDEHRRARDLAARIAVEMNDHHQDHVRVFHNAGDGDNERHNAMTRMMRDVMGSRNLPEGARLSDTVVSVRLGPEGWMNTALITRAARPLIRQDAWITFFFAAVAISVIVVIALRRITRPLGALSDAAGKLGRGEDVQPLAEDGPADVREAIHAFNDMQDRLKTFVSERTRMLAAISHDLRTPITALRLRAEMLDDDEARERMTQTLIEMQEMIEATLAFAREEASAEPTRPCNLGELLDAVCDELRPLGHAIELTVATPVIYPCRTLALKRALSNLIENAALYGKQARVTLSLADGAPMIVIDDDGPGIPDADMERIFEPFVRLDASRSTETGGSGLGMSIARDIVHRHGGGIALNNRTEGGLRVTVTLPAAQQTDT
jgi:signal transduction histidine kinase